MKKQINRSVPISAIYKEKVRTHAYIGKKAIQFRNRL